MKIKKLIIKKLYGYLNKTVEFNENINLLVGINGSGKTSILNIITWSLSPSLPHLGVTEFESIELSFIYDDKDYTVKIVQEPKILTINVTNVTDDYLYTPLKVKLRIPPHELSLNEVQKERIFNEYLGLSPDKDETETWNFLDLIVPKPIVIGLDRHLFKESKNEVIFIDDRVIQRTSKDINKTSPLDEVKRLANREYNIYKSKLVELNSVLNNKIMLSAFDEITPSTLSELENIPIISMQQVGSLHRNVLNFFKENINEVRTVSQKRSDSALTKIDKYFTNLKNVITDAEQAKSNERLTLLYLSNLSQFKKLREFIKEFEIFEKKSQEAYSNLKIYLETINRFFSDSSKELTFVKRISELSFNVLDRHGKIVSRERDIKTLSSGEKQILILLTYLKFYDYTKTIFIIDEPELSLHPKWQEDFLDAVKLLTPNDTQIIIATHSPIIVDKNKQFCKVLLPYNN